MPTKPQIPDLSEVIRHEDVSQKGTGSYAADYVNWCRTMHAIRKHAPGWQFHLRKAPDGSHVWRAPNGTGYVVGYFRGPGPEPIETPDFPQAVMDHRNNPIPVEKLSARDITDTHRRALCTCAAFSLGFAWQLWAREEIEDPHRGSSEPAPAERDQLQAQVIRRLKKLGVTSAGMQALISVASNGAASSMGQLDDAVLKKLLTGAIPQAKVNQWNDAGAALEADAADPPATWDIPEPAAA